MTRRWNIEERLPHAALVAVAIVAALLLIGPATARAQDAPSGSFIVLDGPQAGTTLPANGGVVDNSPLHAHGTIAAGTAGCSGLHFEGRVGKTHASAADCWHVVPRGNATSRVLSDIAYAIASETAATSHWSFDTLERGIRDLTATGEALKTAFNNGQIGHDEYSEEAELLKQAAQFDHDAVKYENAPDARNLSIDDATTLKRRFVKDLPPVFTAPASAGTTGASGTTGATGPTGTTTTVGVTGVITVTGGG